LQPGRTQAMPGPQNNAAATPGEPDAAAMLLAARVALKANQPDVAEEDVRKALELDPNSPGAMYFLAHLLEKRALPRDSLAWFTRAAQAAEPSGEDLRMVALDYILLNDTSDALHWLTRSVTMDPTNSEAWYDFGRAWMTQGNYTKALQPMLKALSLQPRMVKAENNLGLIYEAQNRTKDAATAYGNAVRWQAQDPHPSEQPLLNYGTLLSTQQHAAEAVPLLEQAASIAPSNFKIHEELARALDQQGQPLRATTEMALAVKLDPKNPRLHYQLGQMYRHAGNGLRAAEELALSARLYGDRSSESGP
jgi:tetratricopeptide (TPR) repeat protein